VGLLLLLIDQRRANGDAERAWRSGPIKPIAPVYTPRGRGSNSRMICMVRTLGAPVIEAQGNIAPEFQRPELGFGR
jgi:hypothetical protein